MMISQRLRGISEDGEEIDGLLPKLQKAFKEYADIDIQDQNGELRSTFDILSDLADKWDTLTSKQKQYLGEKAAGNRQSKVLNSVMQGWQDVERAVQSAYSSMGSATEENERVMDSIQGRLNALTSAWQQFAQNTLDSDFVKDIITFGTNLIKLMDTIGGLPTILLAVFNVLVLIKGQKIIDYVSKLFANISNLKSAFIRAKDSGNGFTKSIIEAGNATLAASQKLSLIVTAITLLVSVLNSLETAEREAREERKRAVSAAIEESDSLTKLRERYYSLQEQYQNDKTVKSELTSVTDQLLKKLGLESDKVNELSTNYKELNNAINSATLDSLKETQSTLAVALKDAENLGESIKKGLLKGTDGTYSYNDLFGISRIYTSSSDSINNAEYKNYLKDYFKDNLEGVYFTDSFKTEIEFDVNNISEVKSAYDNIGTMIDALNNKYDILQLSNNDFYKSLISIKDGLKEEISVYDSALTDYNNNIAQQQIITSLINQKIPETAEEFKTFKQELLTNAEAVNENGNRLWQYAGAIDGVESIVNSMLSQMPEFAKFFKTDIPDVVEDTSVSIIDLNENLTILKETYESTFKNQDTFQSALDKINKGTALTSDEVLKLVELYPSLANSFSQTADGWTIDAQKIIDANDDIVQSTKNSVQEQIDGYQDIVDRYSEYQTAVSKLHIPDTNAYQQALQNLADKYGVTAEDAEEAQEKIDGLNLVLQMLGITLGETTGESEDLSKALKDLSSKSQKMSKAFQEQDESGKLSADTILDIIDAGYGAVLMYNKETGAVTLNKEAYIALAKAELEELKAKEMLKLDSYVEMQKLRAEAAEHAAKGEYAVAKALWEQSAALAETAKGYSDAQARIAAIDDMIANLGNYNVGGSSKTEDAAKTAFDNYMREFELAHDRGLISDEEYYEKLSEANEKFYKDNLDHADDYENNITKIYNAGKDAYKKNIDEQITALDEQFSKGLISASKYVSELRRIMIQNYGEGSEYYGTEFAKTEYNTIQNKVDDSVDDIYKERYDTIKSANDGSIQSEKEFIQKWKDLNEKLYKNDNPKKYKENLEEIAKYEEDFNDKRVENEKDYWEQQKKAVEDYYDNEIKKLEDIKDAQEKINKQEELRNNLIKARQKLEEARKNKNQLVFDNGTFKYEADQEAVNSAQEDVADAEKSISDQILQDQIDELKAKKDADFKLYDDLIQKIDDYINKVVQLTSDPEILGKIITSDYSSKNIAIDNPNEQISNATENYTKISESDFLTMLGTTQAKYDEVIGRIDSIIQKAGEIAKPTETSVAKTVNNSVINNNPTNTTTFNGGINITMPEGTPHAQIEKFAQLLNNSLKSLGGQFVLTK